MPRRNRAFDKGTDEQHLLLQGEKVRLRAVKNSDLERLYDFMSSPSSWGDYEPFAAQDWFSFEKNMRERGGNPSSAALFLIESRTSRLLE